MVFIFASNAFGQNTGSGGYRDGYGSSGAMGQNPDDLMKYGRDMMRYGFHEMGMPGGNKVTPNRLVTAIVVLNGIAHHPTWENKRCHLELW